ncbi:hypothetical protein SteCoe_14977 [Stentor coeruleus]|uniref:CRAL-TRIO domain-containing protein n=1 Tax=Stentor coeruleus TaxID=5963 RepID=A0A1R2C4T8_9CILI|nr:hypothetical protein SteCoe_14977 [Stentor coeruleus]
MESILTVSSQEQGPLCELTKLIHEITDEEKYTNQDMLIRVLRARDLKVQPAYEMWQKWYRWRKDYRADEITEEEMKEHIKTGKAFFFGEDNEGRPCLIVRARYHWPNQFALEETMRYVIYLVEQGVKLADEKHTGQMCVIYDRGDISSANKDGNLIELGKGLAAMLQDFYAERLGAVYILHVNWLYWLIFQAVKPLLNKKTRNKIHILRNVEGLKEHFNPSQLLVEYGGENEFRCPYPERN